jgi:hypothetical protein
MHCQVLNFGFKDIFMDDLEGQSKGGLTIMKIVSIMLVALMMLFTVAMAVNAEDTAAKEAIEKDINATEHAAEEVKETVAAVSENATVEAEVAKEKVTEAVKTEEKAAPGFEGIFAIAGLLAIASLVLSRRE